VVRTIAVAHAALINAARIHSRGEQEISALSASAAAIRPCRRCGAHAGRQAQGREPTDCEDLIRAVRRIVHTGTVIGIEDVVQTAAGFISEARLKTTCVPSHED
jgi:hypothetical protein